MLIWAALRYFAQRVCAWFLLYVVGENFFGFFVGAKTSDCMPFINAFSEIESNCSNHNIELFWFITLGIPRFLTAPPAVFISLMVKSIIGGSFSVLFQLIHVVASFLLFIPVAWVGYRHWRTKSRVFAIGLVISLVAEILALAVMA